MKIAALGAIVMLTATFPSAAAAQGGGTFEAGAFATASYFDRTLRLEQAAGGGGARFGVFLSRNLEIEGDGSFVPPPPAACSSRSVRSK
jgi:hypothetical protein